MSLISVLYGFTQKKVWLPGLKNDFLFRWWSSLTPHWMIRSALVGSAIVMESSSLSQTPKDSVGKWARQTVKNWLNIPNNTLKKKVKTFWFICSQLFCDFGEEFEVLDKDGEMPASAMIQSISRVKPSTCFTGILKAFLTYPAFFKTCPSCRVG